MKPIPRGIDICKVMVSKIGVPPVIIRIDQGIFPDQPAMVRGTPISGNLHDHQFISHYQSITVSTIISYILAMKKKKHLEAINQHP